MTKEVVKKGTTAVALPTENLAWGSEGVDATDVVIPKLLLMQGLSNYVAEGKAALGDIVRSTTGEILGNAKKGVEIIPLLSYKTWKISEKVGNKFEFRSQEPITALNVNEPLEWTQGGSTWRRDRCLNFYVLLPSDVKREAAALDKLKTSGEFPDPKDALLPCVLTFQRTSYGAGKALSTHFLQAASFNRPPAVSTFKLISKMDKNDQGTFFIYEVENAGLTSEADLAVCKRWYETITNSKVKVDEADMVEPKRKAAPVDTASPKRTDDTMEIPF